ncbi:MAG: hypothetical protein ACUZ8O_07005 [Candidatus Anammoxibacter sp.]
MRDVKMVVVICVLFFSAVCFNCKLEAGTEDLYERVQMMEDEINALKKALKEQQTEKKEVFVREQNIDEEREKKIDEVIKSFEATKTGYDKGLDDYYFAKRTQELADKGLATWFGDIRTKSFLTKFGKNTVLGGYMDVEYRATEASSNTLVDTPNTPAGDRNGEDTFRQFRFIPFIYADVSERIKMAAELEFEFGGVGGGRAGEVIIEFATIDFLITDWINWRGGVILSPLGKLNLVHDTPMQDFVDRPMVNQTIIPTTLSEVGMGFFGEFYPTELSKLSYEAYIVNGFEGLDVARDGTGRRNFSRAAGLAGSNGGYRENQNNSLDFVGRLAYSPFLGLELGASVHTGKYDEKNDNRLTIAAFDWIYQKGPFEFVGEIARDYIERDTFARIAGITEDMWGYYAEVRYHFMPEILRNWAPTFFTEQSTFTAVIRHGHVQTVSKDRETDFTNIARGINTNPELFFLRDRITLGLNYRITEDTVFKIDYQINTEHKDLQSASNNQLLFQVSTYF